MPGVREQLQDLRIHIFDNANQILARLDDIVQLCGQEAIAFLQRLVLLQGQRVDLAQRVEVFFCLLQPLGFGGAIEILARRVVLEQVGNRNAELLHDLALCLIHAHLGLAAGNLRVMRGVGQAIQLLAGRGDCLLRRLRTPLQYTALCDQLIAFFGGSLECLRGTGGQILGMLVDSPRQPRLCLPAGHRLIVAGLGLALVLGLAPQGLSPARCLAHLFLGAAGRHLGLYLHGLDLFQGRRGGIAFHRGRFIRLLFGVHARQAVTRLRQLLAQAGQLHFDIRSACGGFFVLSLVCLVLFEQALVIALPRLKFVIVLPQCSLGTRRAHARIVRRQLRAFERAG